MENHKEEISPPPPPLVIKVHKVIKKCSLSPVVMSAADNEVTRAFLLLVPSNDKNMHPPSFIFFHKCDVPPEKRKKERRKKTY